MKEIVIGTRGSKLALIQAEIIQTMLKRAIRDLSVRMKIIKTEGDLNQNPIPLDTVGKGWFTKEIEEELLAGTIDVAAHSLKDMPEVLPRGLALICYPEREDARDVLVSRGNKRLSELKPGAKIGTDSERRRAQLLAMRRDIVVESIRGNVPTRVQKMDDGQYDAIILAYAGLKRLGIENRIAQIFEIAEVTPAPGQGILAVEARASDAGVIDIFGKINDTASEIAAAAERAYSKAMGGGCKTPVGAFAMVEKDSLELLGMVAARDGSKIVRRSMRAPSSKPENAGQDLAGQIRKEAIWYSPES